MKKIALMLAIVLVALATYLCLWPVPIDPVYWKAPTAPGYTGAHAVNDKLAGLKVISLGAYSGPEHIALAKDGKLYATVTGGNILRMNADGTAQEVFVNTGGRVLGFDFDATGNLIAADAHKGLLSISPDRQITVLANTVEDDTIRFADAVVVAANGKIYFSDASTRFAAIVGVIGSDTVNASILDVMEQSATGRILEYDPAVKTTRIVAKGLSFANGVALSRDE
jgi:sugar lactone lactonase YvrE